MRQEPELGAQHAHERVVAALDEGHGRTEQREAGDALRRPQAELERDPAAERVADDVGALDAERVHASRHGLGEPARVVGRGRGLEDEPKPGRSRAWTR